MAGSRWKRVSGNLMQIDSGSFGIVWGVNKNHHIFCRIGVTVRNPRGQGWARVPGSLKHVSCGQLGCWGVNRYRQIWFRYGVRRRTPQGKN